jgi:hypothetical protein
VARVYRAAVGGPVKPKPIQVAKVKRGEVWWANVYPVVPKQRPVLVISNDEFNKGDGAIVIPFSGQYQDREGDAISHDLTGGKGISFLMPDRLSFVHYALWLDPSQQWLYPFKTMITDISGSNTMKRIDRFLFGLFQMDIDNIM